MFTFISEFFKSPTVHPHAHAQFTTGTAITTASVASTGLFWGLSMPDIYMAISCIAAICGVIIQLVVAIHNMKK